MPADGGEDLRDFHRRWPSLQPPLRPHADVGAAIRALLPQSDRPVLLLGVTPELACVPDRVVAMDWSARIAAVAWPGNDARRTLVLADWRTMPLADGSVSAVIGDGSLSMLRDPDEVTALILALARVTGPGGRAIFRCFSTPDPAETIESLRALALAGATGFHEWKMRFNMAVAARDGVYNVPSNRLFDAFEILFPDRDALSAASGWSRETIGEIDAYRGSRYAHCYPTRERLTKLLPAASGAVRFLPSGDYPGAAHCPLLVIDFA